ncbi:MAG: radical SAM protein [Thermoanaerobaculales bacterium]|jgi:pyruvate-formate lyase-activating enzyme|nr:radical SAM protein [Thermoanaerobaculales bacterium]
MLQYIRQAAKAILGPRVLARYRRWRYERSGPDLSLPERACHFDLPFVTQAGDVYPCCRSGGAEYHRIGNIGDPDFADKMRAFSEPCSCHGYRLRAAREDERVRGLSIETSLSCQATCSVCCVDAPAWNQEWDRYDELSRFIDSVKPETVLVQGGEVLIQKDTMRWLEELREKYPTLQLNLVTNGNVPTAWIDRVEALFTKVTVSFVGFQPETYESNMGLHVERAMAFTEALVARGIVQVAPKYLVTPTGLHEVTPFLKWALSLRPPQIHFFDAQTIERIGGCAADPFWKETIARASRKLKATLVRHRNELQHNPTLIYLEPPVDELLGIDRTFLEEHGLQAWCRQYRELVWQMPEWEPCGEADEEPGAPAGPDRSAEAVGDDPSV